VTYLLPVVAAGHSVDVDPARWQELFDELLGRVAGRFGRVEQGYFCINIVSKGQII